MFRKKIHSILDVLSLFLLVCSSFLSSCSIRSTATMEQTQTAAVQTETQAILQTDEPISMATATSTTSTPAASSSSTLSVILTESQAKRLHASALKYLAPDEASAIQMAKSMNFLGVNGYPSTMCGPLAFAILRDAGLLESGLDLRNYFYLDPRPGHNDVLTASTFPDELYQKIELNQPSYTIDFSKHPLMAGDFVYLFAGNRGNFDHIITVDYVDSAGRAYAVTNLNTSKGYVISEVMLYDPTKPGVGQIYDWTSKTNSKLGLTGFGGVWIWRLKRTPPEPDAAVQQFRQNVLSEENKAGGEWNIYIQPIGQDPIYSESAYMSLHPASTIKVADAVLFFKALDKKGITDYQTYMDTYGTASRSFTQLLHAMLVYSEEAATSALEEWTANVLDPNQTLHDLGYTQTFISPRQSSAREMAQLLIDLYQGKLVNSKAREIILNYLAEETPNDSTLLGVIRPSLNPGDILYDKRGEIANERTVVADLGLLVSGGKTYAIAIYAYYDTDKRTGSYDELQAALESISREFWQTLQKE